MASSVITELTQVSADWLTAVLARSGALTAGAVTGFDADTGGGNWSDNARLTVRYSADAAGDCPTQLFLKLVDTDTGDGEFFLPAEVTIYTRDYVDVPDAPLLRCYDAAYDAAIHRYHVLLDDVSATHTDARDMTPTLDYGLALADGLATLHARWWGAAPQHDADHIRRLVAIAEPGVAHAVTHYAADLRPHWPDLLRELFARLPDRLIARTRDAVDLTLIHGDSNPGNILVGKGEIRPIYLIDCQPFDWGLITWSGAYDLAYAVALYWDTDLRRAHELTVLRRYHDQLRQRGVTDYAWEQLYDDYRLNVALCVAVAVEYVRGGPNLRWRDFISAMLRRILTACDDLDCRSLWSAQ